MLHLDISDKELYKETSCGKVNVPKLGGISWCLVLWVMVGRADECRIKETTVHVTNMSRYTPSHDAPVLARCDDVTITLPSYDERVVTASVQ